MRFSRFSVSLAALIVASPSLAQQAVLQGDAPTPGHIPNYATGGFGAPVVRDGGNAGGEQSVGQNPSEIGITPIDPQGKYPSASSGHGPLGEHFCMFDAATTNPAGYHYLCLDPNAQGSGLIDYGAGGGATALPLTIRSNGLTQTFPFATSGGGVNYNLQVFDPRSYGAKCDGVTDDYNAFQAAQNAARTALPAGRILVPLTGFACLISHGIALANGVVLEGITNGNFQGFSATVTNWCAYQSCLQSTDTTNPTVTLQGHGSGVRNLNFIRAQQIPSNTNGVAWTPTPYPFEISDQVSFTFIENVRTIGAYNGISIAYNSASGGGTNTWISHAIIDAAHISFQTVNANDTLYIQDIHARPLYYAVNANVIAYREAGNAIGWDAQYTDNAMVHGVECVFVHTCISASNSTSFGNTHSMFNIQISALQCGLVVKCIYAPPGTIITGQINELLAQSDTGAAEALFDLQTDIVDLSIGSLSIPYGGGAIAKIGGGTRGKLTISSAKIGAVISGIFYPGYSGTAAGQTAFVLNAGATLAIAQKTVIRTASAGQFIAGAGVDNVIMPTFCWTPFATFTQANVTGTGSTAGFTTDNFMSSAYYGNFQQVRLRANVDVTTPQSGTMTLSAANFATDLYGNSINVSASTAGAGFTGTLDSGWKEANDPTGTPIGRLNINAPNASVLQFGDVTFCGR